MSTNTPIIDERGHYVLNHVNTRYEYETREVPFNTDTVSAEFDKMWTALGWRRAWADVSVEGVFIVYRREKKR
jgi:hypothetical protein